MLLPPLTWICLFEHVQTFIGRDTLLSGMACNTMQMNIYMRLENLLLRTHPGVYVLEVYDQ